MISIPCYCTREAVKRALDIKGTARSDSSVDEACEAAVDAVDGRMKRRFLPTTATRYFDWPDPARTTSTSYRLWLDEDELISASQVISGGAVVAPANYNLEPANSGPPYERLEILLSSSASFGGGSTHQRSIAITGDWGFRSDLLLASSLAASLDATATTTTIGACNEIGVGSLIRVGTERMIVTNRTTLTTGQTATLTASAANQQVAVSSGPAFVAGEVLLVDSERLLVVDVVGDSLVVKRAWDGSTLAAHTGATIYSYRTLSLRRGATGTTAATHSSSAPVSVHLVPALIRELATAEALDYTLQRTSGWSRSTGSGDRPSEQAGMSLPDIQRWAMSRYARRARSWAV